MTTRDAIEASRAALASNDRVHELARLRDPSTPADLRVGVLAELVDFCAYSVQGHFYAREALGLIDRAVVKERLWPLIEPYLDGSDSQPFRNLAGVLAEVGLIDDLRRLVDLAGRFDDYDIREVADDFRARA